VVTDQAGRPGGASGLARWLETVAPLRARGQVVIALVPDPVMRRLNRRFAGIDRVTDVLSFPAGPEARPAGQSRRPAGRVPVARGPRALGDIVIAAGRADRQARTAGHAFGTEVRVLALHGLLHLLGHDHHTDSGAMARLERRLRRRGGLPEGLIERAAS
jgi:probable rRNA maturation factor